MNDIDKSQYPEWIRGDGPIDGVIPSSREEQLEPQPWSPVNLSEDDVRRVQAIEEGLLQRVREAKSHQDLYEPFNFAISGLSRCIWGDDFYYPPEILTASARIFMAVMDKAEELELADLYRYHYEQHRESIDSILGTNKK